MTTRGERGCSGVQMPSIITPPKYNNSNCKPNPNRRANSYLPTFKISGKLK